MKELTIEARLENLNEVLDFTTTELDANDCDIKTTTQVMIAVEEIFVNIARYAYNPKIGGAVIRISIDDEILIEFEDNGTPYNPLEKTDPDISKSAEDREIGGLGIFMVKKTMDSVNYKHVGNKNILTIKKSIDTEI